MIADVMTKDKNHKKDQGAEMAKLISENIFAYGNNEDNLIIWEKDEIVLKNPKQKTKPLKLDDLDVETRGSIEAFFLETKAKLLEKLASVK